jgi:hypothetical protein
VTHDFEVFVQQRFALRAVGDDGVGSRGEFDMRGKAAAARADDAGQPDLRLLIDYAPSEAELTERRRELQLKRDSQIRTREHETGN